MGGSSRIPGGSRGGDGRRAPPARGDGQRLESGAAGRRRAARSAAGRADVTCRAAERRRRFCSRAAGRAPAGVTATCTARRSRGVVAALEQPGADEVVRPLTWPSAGRCRGASRARSCGPRRRSGRPCAGPAAARPRDAERPEVAVGGGADAPGHRSRQLGHSPRATSAVSSRHREHVGACSEFTSS